MRRSSAAAKGTQSRKLSTSAQACVISTPVRPKTRGRMRISGMKNSPFRAEEVSVDLRPWPLACSIMLVIRVKGKNGSATA